jgi:hypothetical protein
MDDTERAALEGRLRAAVVGRKPQAPDALFGFIDTVPDRGRATRGLDWLYLRPAARRSVFALATAAAVIFAVVAGVGLVAVRNVLVDQSAPGVDWTSGGWSWQRADGTNVIRISQVAHGYLGSCGQEQTLCTSPDGLHWTTPADHAIVVVDGGGYFDPEAVAQRGGIYVATSQSSSISNPSCAPDAMTCNPTTVIWRSTDGLHWSRVDSPAFAGLTLMGVTSVANGFLAYAASTPEETGWALTSTDGLTWVRASRLPVQPQTSNTGVAGLQVGSADVRWRTIDGTNWTPITTPAGLSVGSMYAIPGGGFVALGISSAMTGDQILTSTDGLTWRVDAGDLRGVPLALDSVGGRLFADVSSSPLNSSAYPDSSAFASNAFEIWKSDDWGRTWQPLLDASRNQMSGLVTTVGGRLFISSPDPAVTNWRISWVGTPPGMAPIEPVIPAATNAVSTPTSVTPPATAPVPAPTALVPPATPSGGISQADAIRIAAVAVVDSPGAAPSSAALVEAGQASLVYGNPVVVEPQPRWVWVVTYGAPESGTGPGGTVVIDYATGAVVGGSSWGSVDVGQ